MGTLKKKMNAIGPYLLYLKIVENVLLFMDEKDRLVLGGLKVLALPNKKRGVLKVVAFDMSPFKLFRLRFSTKSVQAPSCERPITTQRNLFLFFANNNCFPITVQRRYFNPNSLW